jgi:N-acylneuraminate cytidylyltransferase
MRKKPRLKSLQTIEAVVMDFDGVHTDDLVYVSENGTESVCCSRSDGMGLAALRESGFQLLIISKEINPVVSMRGKKLSVEVIQNCDNKIDELKAWLQKHDVDSSRCLYIGNDINDIECLQYVGIAAAPADAHSSVRKSIAWQLKNKGGRGALRELSDELIRVKGKK